MTRVLSPGYLWTPEGIRRGWSVAMADGVITALAPAGDLPGEPFPDHLLIPGLVNAHSHAFQRAFRGHVQWTDSAEDSFWTWRSRMYAAAGALPPEGLQAMSALAFLEMAEAGITEVGEFHYLHHQPGGAPYDAPDELARRVIAAALDVGVRITLLRVLYARGGIGEPPALLQRRFCDTTPEAALMAVERLRQGADPRVRVGLAPHSIRAVPAEWLPKLAGFEGVIHSHVAEQPAEVAACLEAFGCSPLALLADAGLVDERFTAVHLTHPSRGDIDRLVSAEATACVCPSTELDLGDGLAPLDLRRRARLCIGTDSHAVIDPFYEARTVELHARAQAGQRNVLSPVGDRHGLAARLLGIATAGGRRSLGAPEGAIAVGAPADLALLDLRRPAAAGMPPLEAAVFVATPDWVRGVWVGGEPIVVDGLHPRRDAILAAALPWFEEVDS